MSLKAMNLKTTWICLAAMLMSMGTLVQSVDGTLVTYTDRDAWLLQVDGAPSGENLNAQTVDLLFGNGTFTAASGMKFTSNVNNGDSGTVEAIIDVPGYRNSLGGNGTAMLSARGIDNGEIITLTLPTASSAFGFEYDNYDAGGDTSSFFAGGIDTLADIGSSTGFLGVIDDSGSTFSTVSFRNAGDGISIFNAFDNFEYGTAVPEPSAFAFMGLVSVLGFGVAGLRRKRDAAKQLQTGNPE